MKKEIIAILFFGIILGSCNSTNSNTLSGELENAAGKTVYIEKFEKNQATPLDSAKVAQDGSFEMPTPKVPLGFYRLSLGDDMGILLIMDSTDSPVITGDASNLGPTYTVEGSEHSKLLLSFYRTADKYKTRMEEIVAQIRNPSQADGDRNKLRVEYQDIAAEYRDTLSAFIEENSQSPAALAVINELDIKKDLEIYELVKNNLEDKFSHNEYWQALEAGIAQAKQEAQSEKRLAEGSEAPEINLNDPNGNPVALSSLRGKYVLIDFWASWCGPCRRENPHVVKMYNKYKDLGFEIYGVSLDQSHEKWVQAIKQDKLEWVQVSDLKFWQSAAARLYNINSIPATILLDPEGRIIAKNLRGPSLEKKLEEVLGT